MLEQCVGRLEEKVDRIEAAVGRIEAMAARIQESATHQAAEITEIKATAAKQTDLNRLQIEISEIKASGAKQADLNKAQMDLAEVKGRVAALPTWWMLLTAILATGDASWGTGFAIANSINKSPIQVEKPIERTSPK